MSLCPLWSPSSEQIANARVTAFRQDVSHRWGVPLADFEALYQWSIHEPARFWESVWDFCQVVSQCRFDTVLTDGDKLPGASWCNGAQLNFAENLLPRDDASPAIIFRNEHGPRREISWADLRRQVAQFAATLRRCGIQPGDRVAGWLPNIPEAVVAMLASASIGAVWSSCSPDFGVQGVLDRFGQIAPRVLIAVDGYVYGGKSFEVLDKLYAVRKALPSVEQLVIVPYLTDEPDLTLFPDAALWAEFLDTSAERIEFAPLPFAHPLYILYSSGTTGVPKCIVHGAGGTLLKHLSELVLHCDLRRDERICYYTTTGWMMWNWLVSSLAVGATIVLYDGSPAAPHAGVLFDLVDQEQINVFGTSAKYLASIDKAGVKPIASHRLTSLRAILSTGSPLMSESFDYVYQSIKADVLLSSISGGTDLIGCFALGCPVLGVVRGELQTRALGCRVEIYDDAGHSLPQGAGELVCTAPFPSVPVSFWNDPGDEKFRQAYFDRWPNVWRHGDWAELTPRGGMIIYGRSDAVLNPGGVRIGTAEIYRQVEQLPEVLESLAIGQQWDGDVRVVLFVKLRPGVALDDALRQRIVRQIRLNTTPRHVPAKIIAVPDIPRTKSGKIVELAVRDVVHDRPIKNAEALLNPEALEHFRSLPELAT